MARTWSQQSQRVFNDRTQTSGRKLRDQHGNIWHCEVELKTGDPCSPPMPCQPAVRPWRPDGQYFRKPDEGDHYVGYDLEIDYPRLKAETLDAWRVQQRQVAELKAKHPHYTTAMAMAEVGKPRLHPRVIDEAAKGNGYLHGNRPFDPSNKLDVWLKAYVDPAPVEHAYDWIMDQDIPGPDDVGEAPADELSATQELEYAEQIRALKAQQPKWSWKQIGDKLGLSADEARRLAKLEPAIPGHIDG